MRAPDYRGGGLVNLIAEFEHRLTGSSGADRLAPDLAARIPRADSYVMVLFDGLGTSQLGHPNAARLRADLAGSLDAPFSTQTSVATSTIATGLPPSQHGLLSYLLALDGAVVNTLWWFATDGSTPAIDLGAFLPTPDVGERLATAGAEAVVIEPAAFLGGPLDRLLYRSTTVIGTASVDERIDRTLEAAAEPGRMILCYVPDVDASAHTQGFGSPEYAAALTTASRVWDDLADRLPTGAALVGTADHGMVSIDRPITVQPPAALQLAGDGRVLHVHGPEDISADFADDLPARWIPFSDASDWWGPPPLHPAFADRAPDSLIVADSGVSLHHAGNPAVLACEHGGVTEEELRIPLLIGGAE